MKKPAIKKSLLLLLSSLLLSSVNAAEDNNNDVESIEVFAHSIASGYQTVGTQQFFWSAENSVYTPRSVVDILARAPGVSLTESGGIIQTISIRGVGRQGVLMLLDGIPMSTNRRAGTGLHFIDPMLLSELQLLSGPASAVYGSGALGGVVNAQPRWFNASEVGVQWDHNGNGQHWWGGSGNEQHSIAFAHYDANNSEAADGTELNDHVTRNNLIYIGQHQSDWGHLEWLLAPAQIRDLGRVANDTRITFGPEENHYPLRLAYSHQTLESALSFYDAETVTDILNPDGSRQLTRNEANNTTWNLHKRWPLANAEYRVGYEYSARNGVKADEIEKNSAGGEIARPALPDGNEDQHALFASALWNQRAWSLHAGLRYAQITQRAQGYGSDQDNALSLSAGVNYQFNSAWSGALALSNGVRFPALTERYYNGVTPRGTTVGNPDLKAETARAIELSTQWKSESMQVDLHYFNQQIDDYIERIRLAPATPRRFTYVNLTSGKIAGVELNYAWQLSDVLSAQTRVHRIRGESDKGEPLSGMPSDTISVGLGWQLNDCHYAVDGNWRDDHADVSSDEVPLAARHYFDLEASCQLNPRWNIAAALNNAADQQWLLNTDANAGFARGRNLSLTIRFTP